ncbi:MAG: tRNA lysidine(34) synthetase TilS [Spirochaetales bacterium]|nr:tRNA lysidine(34) synthetase TilS [Spirochaetales bacterium]
MSLTVSGQVCQVLEAFRRRPDILVHQNVAVAYSGGCDSAVLLWAASVVWGPDHVTAIWVDHGLRPAEERQAEAHLVESFCQQRGVLLIKKGPPAKIPHGEGQEDSFRIYRLQVLQEAALAHDISLILTAHHRQDQAETMLFRLLQGRSWVGLAGIPEKRGLFARPFLSLPRELLRKAAQEQHLFWHEDSTNSESLYQRNFLRNEVFPLLEQRFPLASQALAELAQFWRERNPLLHWLDSAWVLTDNAVIPRLIWEQWTTGQREHQLLEVVRRLRRENISHQRLSRRFLAEICQSSHLVAQGAGSKHLTSFRHCGAGWQLAFSPTTVTWSPIVQEPELAYLMTIDPPCVLTLARYEIAFSWEPWSETVPFAWVELPHLEQPQVQDLVWRSLGPEESWVLPAGKSNKAWRRKHPGDAGLFYKGVLWAVFDTVEQKLRWKGTCADLIKKVIFVKLSRRSMG